MSWTLRVADSQYYPAADSPGRTTPNVEARSHPCTVALLLVFEERRLVEQLLKQISWAGSLGKPALWDTLWLLWFAKHCNIHPFMAPLSIIIVIVVISTFDIHPLPAARGDVPACPQRRGQRLRLHRLDPAAPGWSGQDQAVHRRGSLGHQHPCVLMEPALTSAANYWLQCLWGPYKEYPHPESIDSFLLRIL